jgi:hypothetical protein
MEAGTQSGASELGRAVTDWVTMHRVQMALQELELRKNLAARFTCVMHRCGGSGSRGCLCTQCIELEGEREGSGTEAQQ